ncbi:hypothetical protein CFS9_03020 [Flavobacterium sp. CFS9]|uniref:Phage protein, HK97 gp10 family n=1 Tax=Flavobacterium sp. CFS9 TaxID=3143118 RepID=A0AAT9GWQ4_9FLAO
MNNPLFDVEGFSELKAKISQLANDKDKKREVFIILRQIANPTLQAARSFVPVSSKKHKARGKLIEPGNLKKSLGYITGKQENPTIYVGTRAKGVNNGWYGHFVERGVNKYRKGFKRKRKRGVNDHASIGKTKATPFMAMAYQATSSQVTSEAKQKMAKFIQRRIDKLS